MSLQEQPAEVYACAGPAGLFKCTEYSPLTGITYIYMHVYTCAHIFSRPYPFWDWSWFTCKKNTHNAKSCIWPTHFYCIPLQRRCTVIVQCWLSSRLAHRIAYAFSWFYHNAPYLTKLYKIDASYIIHFTLLIILWTPIRTKTYIRI